MSSGRARYGAPEITVLIGDEAHITIPVAPQYAGLGGIRRVREGGVAWLGGTTWHGMRAMRMSVSNRMTSEAADIERSGDAILSATRAIDELRAPVRSVSAQRPGKRN